MTLVEMFEENYRQIEKVQMRMNKQTGKVQTWQYWVGIHTTRLDAPTRQEFKILLERYSNRDLDTETEKEFEFVLTFSHNQYYQDIYKDALA